MQKMLGKESSGLRESITGVFRLVWVGVGDRRSFLQGRNFKLRFWVKHEKELASQSWGGRQREEKTS